MSLKSELEQMFPQLAAEAQSAWHTLEADAKKVATLLYGAFKIASKNVDAAIVAQIPSAMAMIKAEALACVQNLEQSQQFKNAVGSWKFGTACGMLMRSIESGALSTLPGLMTLGKALAPVIETAIQEAFVTMSISLL